MSLKQSRTTPVNIYDMSAINRIRYGEHGKNSTLGVAKALADYESS